MKKIAIILMCMLICCVLFTGCSKQKNNNAHDGNLSNSVEIDDTDLEIDAEKSQLMRMIQMMLSCRTVILTASEILRIVMEL